MLDVLVAKDCFRHNPLLTERRKGLKEFLPVVYQRMPDADFILRNAFATKDRIATRLSWIGLLANGPLFGIEPLGQPLAVDAIDVWTV